LNAWRRIDNRANALKENYYLEDPAPAPELGAMTQATDNLPPALSTRKEAFAGESAKHD
jgi:hypothetical protein